MESQRDAAACTHDELRTVLKIPRKVLNTGALPIFATCEDGRQYWCKQINNPHGIESVVNEIVGNAIGAIFGAPVCEWKIIDIPAELVGSLIDGGSRNVRLGDKPMFGSLDVRGAEQYLVEGSLLHPLKDGNPQRIPKLMALWVLCNAVDIQVVYGRDDEDKIWSIDHRLWFGCDDGTWQLDSHETLAGRIELPMAQGIQWEDWESACESLEAVTAEATRHSPGLIPSEWGIARSDVERLVEYCVTRTSYARQKLMAVAEKASGRRGR